MSDENQTHLKSLLWTKFIPIDIKSARRQSHSPEFMSFARSIEYRLDRPMDFDQRIAEVMNTPGFVK